MRTIPFKEVLWSVAYKLGLNPAQEFLTDEGESLCSYINAWVRRTWDAQDWPEWTTIKEFTPATNHMVPWRAFPVGTPAPVLLSRPLKVYLVDPRLSPYPIDARFREWDEGLHVGFDHGATVWIKYIPAAPRFTSVKWDSGRTYGNGELTYSPLSGECYSSLISGNVGNDPTIGFTTPLSTEIIQDAVPPDPGRPAQPEIIVAIPVIDPVAPPDSPGTLVFAPLVTGTVFTLTVKDQAETTTFGSVTYTTVGGDTVVEVVNAVATLIAAVPGMAGFTVTALPDEVRIKLENDLDFKLSAWYQVAPSSPVAHRNKQIQLQTFIPAVPPSPGLPQITAVVISQDQVRGCTTYSLTFHDPDDPQGVYHTASYYSEGGEGRTQILSGLAGAINENIDPWFETISVSVNLALGTLEISTMGMVSIDAMMSPENSTYWTRQLFPYALFEPVTRGAYSDALREAGQTDKAMAEEQGAVAEAGDRIGKASAPAYDALTDQQRPAPRYRTRARTPAATGGNQ
jgi:hypothetical protein